MCFPGWSAPARDENGASALRHSLGRRCLTRCEITLTFSKTVCSRSRDLSTHSSVFCSFELCAHCSRREQLWNQEREQSMDWGAFPKMKHCLHCSCGFVVKDTYAYAFPDSSVLQMRKPHSSYAFHASTFLMHLNVSPPFWMLFWNLKNYPFGWYFEKSPFWMMLSHLLLHCFSCFAYSFSMFDRSWRKKNIN